MARGQRDCAAGSAARLAEQVGRAGRAVVGPAQRPLAGADRGAQGVQIMAQGKSRTAGDLAGGLVMVVDLNQLAILLLRPRGVLIGWLEQQTLELVEQVLPGVRLTWPDVTPACRSPTNVAAAAAIRRQLGPLGAVALRAGRCF